MDHITAIFCRQQTYKGWDIVLKDGWDNVLNVKHIWKNCSMLIGHNEIYFIADCGVHI